MWNKIYFNEDKKRLDDYPLRDEDVTFIHAGTIHSGYFENDINYEDPSDTVFGFMSSTDLFSQDSYYIECEFVEYWCYTKELIESVCDE